MTEPHSGTKLLGPTVIVDAVCIVAMIGSALLLVDVVSHADRGFDFSDEGSHVLEITRPELYPISVTHFAFVYAPLLRLVKNDLATFRAVGMVITTVLAWWLCYNLVRSERPLEGGKRTHWWRRAGLALILATISLVFLDPWLPTPNYYSLTFQALMLAASALKLADATYSCRSLTGWTLLGSAGWLAFMAKPPAAMLLAFISAGYLCLSRKWRWPLAAIAVATTLAWGLGTTWAIAGSLRLFVRGITLAVDDAKKLAGGHTIQQSFRIDTFDLSGTEKFLLAGMALTLSFAVALGRSRHRASLYVGLGLVLGLCLTSLFVATRGITLPALNGNFRGLQFLSVPLGALLGVLIVSGRNSFQLLQSESTAFAASLLLFPYAFAFGTNGNYWMSASSVAIFWVLAGVVLTSSLIGPPTRMPLLTFAVAAQLIALLVVGASMRNPYRQAGPLAEMTDVVELGSGPSRLRLSHQAANYIRNLRQLATQGGFKPGEPLIDLTGHYPGATYALNAVAVGRPWLIGGYSGSETLATTTLSRVPTEDLKRAWLLIEKTGPRRLPAEILRRHGLELARDYVVVGTVQSPVGEYRDRYEQQLLRPLARDVSPKNAQ